jgi:hypothetical protein
VKTRQFLTVCSMIVMTFGCSSVQSEEPLPTESGINETTEVDYDTIDFPEARSLSLASSSDGSLHLIYGQEHSLFVSRSTDGGRTFDEAVLASGEIRVHVLPIEHPAIAVDGNGGVNIAWLEMPPDFNGAKIWYAVSKDGGQTFGSAQLVMTESEGEVAMVQIALDGEGNPILMWLNESELKFTRSLDGGSTFMPAVSIGDGSCECCQPQAVVLDDQLHIAYRSLEPAGEKGISATLS